MSAFKKHVGRDKNGTRLVVVFREIPGAEDYCLCVQSDSLTEMYHDQLMREVDSRDAQATVNLYEVLERRHFGDGQQMLNGLHAMGRLKKYKVEDVTMMPMPNRPVPLTMVNEQIAGKAAPAEEISVTIPAGTGLPGDTEYIQALNRNLLLAGEGKLTAEEAMGKTAEEWETITEKYGREKQVRYWRAFIKNFPRKSFGVPANN